MPNWLVDDKIVWILWVNTTVRTKIFAITVWSRKLSPFHYLKKGCEKCPKQNLLEVSNPPAVTIADVSWSVTKDATVTLA